MMKRINFNLDSALADKVDSYAAKMHVNRSAALAVIISQFFDAQATMSNLSYLVDLAKSSGQFPDGSSPVL